MPPTLLRTLRIANTHVNLGLVPEAADRLDQIVVPKAGYEWQEWSRAARIAITRGSPKQSAGAWRPSGRPIGFATYVAVWLRGRGVHLFVPYDGNEIVRGEPPGSAKPDFPRQTSNKWRL